MFLPSSSSQSSLIETKTHLSDSSEAIARLLAAGPGEHEAGRLIDGRRWRMFSLDDWPTAWRLAALDLQLFETHDFRSRGQRMHESLVLSGKIKGAYQARSRYRRWWETPDGQTTVDEPLYPNEPQHAQYEVCLVTSPSDDAVLGLSVFDRYELRPIDVLETPMDRRCKPRCKIQVLLTGTATFYVAPDHRGQGLGQALAQAWVDAWMPRMQWHRLQDGVMPVMSAKDRGAALLRRVAPWPVIEYILPNVARQQALWKAGVDEAERWGPWSPELLSIAPTGRQPSRRRPSP